MRDRTRKRVLFVFLLAALLILNLPFVSQWYNDRDQRQVVADYEDGVGGMAQGQMQTVLREAESYNQELAKRQGSIADAFSARESVDEEYDRQLNFGNGMMGYLEIPQIDLMLPIYHGTGNQSLEKGVGHLYGSSLPVGGENTHGVLSAHRGLPSKELFTNLDQMERGDVFLLHVGDRTLAYQVDQTQTVEPSDTQSLSIETGKDYVTLVTCTPYGINSHRLLVRGQRVPWDNESQVEVRDERTVSISDILKIVFAASVVILFVAGKILLFPRQSVRGLEDEKK